MIQINLRLRITAAIVVVCISIVTILGVMLYKSSEKMELALVEQLVSEELDFLVERYQINPDQLPASGLNVQYFVVDSPEKVAQLPEYIRNIGPGYHEIDIGQDQGERDVAVYQNGDTRYIVVYNIGPYEDREHDFKRLILISLVIVAILSLVLGYYLAGFLTRQLSQLAREVATLTPNAPNPPLLKNNQDPEVSMLAQALDQYQAKILDMIQREQEFTANVSHELRTPLTAIYTSCELLSREPGLSAKTYERIHNVSQSTEQMTQIVNTLLFLAREREFSNREPVELLECVEDSAISIRDEISRKGLKFELDIPVGTIIETNRQALQLVLMNLIGNAAKYTTQGFIRISYMSGQLIVSDSGPGIVSDKLPHIFVRNFRGENNIDGVGLGLNIVKRICDLIGWEIQVDSIRASGSRFILTFC